MRSTNSYVFFLCLFFFIGCANVKTPELEHLEGFWEIKTVHAHGEIFQPRGAAPLVDFYHLEADSIGYKKKMTPTFNGLYQSSEDQIVFSVKKEGKRLFLHFDSALTPWKEEILTISLEEMILFHDDKEYHYKRHQKITF